MFQSLKKNNDAIKHQWHFQINLDHILISQMNQQVNVIVKNTLNDVDILVISNKTCLKLILVIANKYLSYCF